MAGKNLLSKPELNAAGSLVVNRLQNNDIAEENLITIDFFNR